MAEYNYISKVGGGKLNIGVSTTIKSVLKQFEGLTIQITIKEWKKQRSSKQNSYWWAVCIPLIRNFFNDLGVSLSAEETHDYVVKKVWKHTEVIMIEGEPYERRLSSTKLNKKEWSEIMDLTYIFFAERGLTIPLPNQYE